MVRYCRCGKQMDMVQLNKLWVCRDGNCGLVRFNGPTPPKPEPPPQIPTYSPFQLNIINPHRRA